MNQSMKILDMHCDTLIECWRHEDRALRDGKGHLNLKMMQEHSGMGAVFCDLSFSSRNGKHGSVRPVQGDLQKLHFRNAGKQGYPAPCLLCSGYPQKCRGRVSVFFPDHRGRRLRRRQDRKDPGGLRYGCTPAHAALGISKLHGLSLLRRCAAERAGSDAVRSGSGRQDEYARHDYRRFSSVRRRFL